MGALGVTHRITNSSNEIVQLFFSLQQMRSLVLLVVLICHGADGFKLTKVASPRLPSATTAPKFPACALPIAMGQQAKVRVRRTPLVHMTEDEAIVISKETALRSFVKAAGWRFTAGVVTATTSFIFTGASECLARSRPFFVAFCPCPSRQLTPPPSPPLHCTTPDCFLRSSSSQHDLSQYSVICPPSRLPRGSIIFVSAGSLAMAASIVGWDLVSKSGE